MKYAQESNAQETRTSNDSQVRVKYLPLLVGIASLIILYGFSEYYFKYFWSVPSRYHVHAIPAIAWLALLVIQPILYHNGNLKAHRILGRIGIGLALIMWVGMFLAIHSMLGVKFDAFPNGLAYRFAFADLNLAIGFIAYVSLAYYHKSNTALHSRYMTATIFFAFVPSVIRVWAFFVNIEPAIDLAWVSTILIASAAYFLDKKSQGLSPFLVIVIWFSALGILMHTIDEWNWWVKMIDSYHALVS